MKSNELKKKLGDLAYYVTQEKGTEIAFTGKYWNEHSDGSYHCIVCDQKIFESKDKFDSGTGWPSFDRAIEGSIKLVPDSSHGMDRVEVVCSKCGAHLGHLFDDGPAETTGERYCINSCAIKLNNKENRK